MHKNTDNVTCNQRVNSNDNQKTEVTNSTFNTIENVRLVNLLLNWLKVGQIGFLKVL
jgi:hypothetical protein